MDVSRSFEEVGQELYLLYVAKRFPECLERARRAASDFPERKEETTLWIADFQACLQDPEGAMATLSRGQQEGVVWAEEQLVQDKDLAPLKVRAEFLEFQEENRRRLQALRGRTTLPMALVFPPEGPPVGPPLLVLHGRGSAPELERDFWSQAASHGTPTLLLRSSQPFSGSRFGWDDLDRTRADLTWAIARLRSEWPASSSPPILGGFSQGAATALYLALSGEIYASGVIAVCPNRWGGDATGSLAATVGVKSRREAWYTLLTGQQDFAVDSTRAVAQKLQEGGFRTHLEVAPARGHEYPRDFPARLPALLKGPL